MIRSAWLYTRYITSSLLGKERSIILRDAARYSCRAWHRGQWQSFERNEREGSLAQAVDWLVTAHQQMTDGGMGSYHLADGWSASYPETTGYIIPTLLEYHKKYGNERAGDAAFRAGEFLLDVQGEEGGWPGGRINENRPVIVFNTGQVIRGMLALYRVSEDTRFLEAAQKAGEWLCRVQHDGGFWKNHALMEQARVYDTYVDIPLLELWDITGKEIYKTAAVKNLDWVVDEKIQENGWPEDCDNTVHKNHKPILHTIAYTYDGLVDAAMILGEMKYLHKALKGATVLKDLFLQNRILNGRYDHNWKGSEHFICTGGAQISIVWMKLFQSHREESFLQAAAQMLDLLQFIQQRDTRETDFTRGAIPGSFPIWGRYEPFAFPNWATKYYADARMLQNEIR